MIKEQHYEDMKSNGYTVLESVFTPAEMARIDELIAKHQERHNAKLLANGGGDGSISRANEITFTDHIAEDDPEIMAFAKRPEFVAVTTAFLGPDTDLYWNQSVYKAAGGTKQFPWHQDDGYMAVDPAPYLTIWLAIGDVTEEN
jgi:ectoine hydroxylase-related dioxygenase (phytanoyl-CoA dioxygenase family)